MAKFLKFISSKRVHKPQHTSTVKTFFTYNHLDGAITAYLTNEGEDQHAEVVFSAEEVTAFLSIAGVGLANQKVDHLDFNVPLNRRVRVLPSLDVPTPYDGQVGLAVRYHKGFYHVLFDGVDKVNLYPPNRVQYLTDKET